MNFSRTTLNGGYFIDTDWNTQITTVRITDFKSGVSAKGNAKLHPTDDFDLKIGYTLAYTRAVTRLLQKMDRRFTKEPLLVKSYTNGLIPPILV